MQLNFINNDDMTAKSVEKYYFIALNVKLHVKIRFEKFYWLLKPFVNAFAWNITTNTQLVQLATDPQSLP